MSEGDGSLMLRATCLEKLRDRGWCEVWRGVVEPHDSPTISGAGHEFVFDSADTQARLGPVEILTATPDADPLRIAHGMLALGRISKCKHAGLQKVLAVMPSSPIPFAILEQGDGDSLDSIVSKNGPLNNAALAKLARQAGMALEALNADCGAIVLRSIKPASITIDASGNAVLSDYTLAVFPGIKGHDSSIDGDDIVGTPQYLSPEQCAGSESVDIRADMYSLGATLYFAATGKVPFGGQETIKVLDSQCTGILPYPRQLTKSLSPELAEMIRRLMAKNPRDRYTDWTDFLSDAVTEAHGGKPRPLKAGVASTIAEPPRGFSGLAADDSDATPSRLTLVMRSILWILLLAWLALVADFRTFDHFEIKRKMQNFGIIPE